MEADSLLEPRRPPANLSVRRVAGDKGARDLAILNARAYRMPKELRDWQGKGYAETIVRHAVAQGQRSMDIRRTTLHASMMGYPLYQAMEYTPGPHLVISGPGN